MKTRPTDGKLGIITLVALGVLSVFGIWIQLIEDVVEVSGYGVLNVEFAMTRLQMDKVIAGFLNHGVLDLEIFVDQLDVLMMPGWSVLFFGCHLLGIRALQFQGTHLKFREKTLKLTLFPLIAGAIDTVENIVIFYILSNPHSYDGSAVPILFVLVLSKFALIFTSIGLGCYGNIMAFRGVILLALKKSSMRKRQLMEKV
ncbi:MAG: hypothetical protein ACFFCS_08680 [Candidatus Hodarchaeota archaeon]